MSLSLIAALIWLILANVIGLLPTKDQHWRSAYLLIAVGIPILGWVTYQNGPIWGMVMAAGGASVFGAVALVVSVFAGSDLAASNFTPMPGPPATAGATGDGVPEAAAAGAVTGAGVVAVGLAGFLP